MVEYVIRNTKARLWLMEYPPNHNLCKLKWTWTLEWGNATRYKSAKEANEQAVNFQINDCILEKCN